MEGSRMMSILASLVLSAATVASPAPSHRPNFDCDSIPSHPMFLDFVLEGTNTPSCPEGSTLDNNCWAAAYVAYVDAVTVCNNTYKAEMKICCLAYNDNHQWDQYKQCIDDADANALACFWDKWGDYLAAVGACCSAPI